MTAVDILFIALAALFLLVGIIGCIIPGLPGTPLCWAGLLVGFFAHQSSISWWPVLIITAIVTVIIEILNNFVPGVFTKKAGGSKVGAWGATIGVFVGIFTGSPLGILLGPFLGALIGELVRDNSHFGRALKAALYSFLGFLTGTGMRLVTSAIFAVIFIRSFFK